MSTVTLAPRVTAVRRTTSARPVAAARPVARGQVRLTRRGRAVVFLDRKSTRLNSSHRT